MSDSFRFDITGAPLEISLAVAFSLHDTAVGWRYRMLDDRYTLVLYWSKSIDNVNPFPSPLTVKEVLPMVEKWLKEAKYEEEPDHDGCNERGWRVFNDAWGRVGGEHGAFVGIQPVWLMYGK